MEDPNDRLSGAPRRRGTSATVRICVDLRHSGDGPEAFRALLAGDLLRRIAERLQQRTAALLVISGRSVRGNPALPTAVKSMTHLNINEPLLTAASEDDVIALSDGSLDAVVVPDEPTPNTSLAASRLVSIGPVTAHPPAELTEIIAELLEEDPLTLRLALLRFHYDAPAQISRARAHRAVETLERWRFKVAAWHDMPPASPPTLLATMHQTLLADLDTPRVLTWLHRIEADPHQPSGRKFAAFADLDHILGLDLGYLIGKPRG